ncbi:ABC transporter substrate-binding protein [Acuticoccus sediminis]|uniref:ABC transporter substrate-binding protein n=1 Tax=Acuticoccus sediminis TaxID=2184697 RepID=UPI001CFCBF86|nr:ABC transporter substrate-binding protein [Acuticoccus sediminis]
MTISRRTFVAGGMGAAALASFGGPAFGQSGSVIRFGPTTTDISTGHAAHSSLPQALGFWEEEGLNVDVFGVAGSTTGMQMVSGGRMEFVTITAEEMLFARANGMPVKTGYQHSRQPISRIVTLKSAGITDLATLRGATVGTPVIHTNPLASGTFAEAGIDIENDIELVATGTGAPAALALRRGDIKAWVSWDTAVAALENLGLEFDYHYPSYYNMLLGNFVTGNQERIDSDPESYIKLCRGIAKAVVFGQANPDAAIRLHWEVYPQTRPQGGGTPEEIAQAKRIFLSRFDGFALGDATSYGSAGDAQWERVIAELAQTGHLDAGFDVSQIWDPSFLEAINDFDREAIAEQARNYAG